MVLDLDGIIWGIVMMYGGFAEAIAGLVMLLVALGAAVHRGVRWPRTHGYRIGLVLLTMGLLNVIAGYVAILPDHPRAVRRQLDEWAIPLFGFECCAITTLIIWKVVKENQRRKLDDSHLRRRG